MLEAEYKEPHEAYFAEGRDWPEEYDFKVRGGMVGDMSKSG